MFENRLELEHFIDETSWWVTRQPMCCHVCNKSLVGNDGYAEFKRIDDYPDLEFCSDTCIMEYLISMGYLNEEEE